MGSVLNEIEPAERWKVIDAVGNAKVGGLAGIGISVAVDGAVGLSSAGVTTVAGVLAGNGIILLGVAGGVVTAPAIAILAVTAVVGGVIVSIFGEGWLDSAFGADKEKQILKDALRAVNNKIGEAIHDAYFKAIEASNGALNTDDRTLNQAIDSWKTQSTNEAFSAIDSLTGSLKDWFTPEPGNSGAGDDTLIGGEGQDTLEGGDSINIKGRKRTVFDAKETDGFFLLKAA